MTRVSDFKQYPDTLLPEELNNIQDDYGRLYENLFPLINGSLIHVEANYQFARSWILTPDPRDLCPVMAQNSVNPPPEALLYWDPAEWGEISGDRELKWVLRSTLITGGTAPLNSSLFVNVRRMEGDWHTASLVDSYLPAVGGETLQTFWEPPPGAIALIHAASSSVQTINMQQFDINVTTRPAGWYSIFLGYSAPPDPDARAMVFANLMLRMESRPAFPYGVLKGRGGKYNYLRPKYGDYSNLRRDDPIT